MTKNIAVIGTGYWGKNIVRNFFELGCLKSICERDADRIKGMSAQYPDVSITASLNDILNDSLVDGVAISTPAEMHFNMAMECLLAGKDVYVEKPLCLTADYGEKLVKIARDTNRILMVGHLLWYHPAVIKLKEMIDNGDLGKLQYIYSNRLNLGKIRREENILWSFAPHDISIILGLIGEEPDEITATGGNYLHKKIADVTMSCLTFPSGIKAHIFVSWLHPFKEQRLVVIGEKGMAVFNDVSQDNKLTFYPHTITWHGLEPVPSKAEAINIDIEKSEPLKSELSHFLDCIKSRKKPRTDGEEGLRVLKVLQACQDALEKEQPFEKKAGYGHESVFIHETAVVDPKVRIGADTKIWHFSHILSGSVIGKGCNIGQNVVIGPSVHIGNGCKIQNNVSVYQGVVIEDDVFCGPSMVFTNVINPRASVSRKNEFKKTHVKKGATIGANATIICGNQIGKYAFIAAGAVVTKDVPDYAMVMGNPGRVKGWFCSCGEKLSIKNSKAKCTACKKDYILKQDILKNLNP